MLAGPVDGLFAAMLYFITMDNAIIYNLTVNQSVIIRYVKVIRTFAPIFPAFYSYFSAFSVITLVLEIITSWFTADYWIMMHSFIWYQFEMHPRPSTAPEKAIFAKKVSYFYDVFTT